MEGHKGTAALICLFVLTGFLAVHETGVAPWLKSSSADGGWGTVRFAVTADLAQPTEASAQNAFTEGAQFTWQELVEAVIEQGVPYDINAQLAVAAPSSSASGFCSALLQQASQTDVCIQLDSREALSVLLCMQPGNAAGTLLIYSLEPTGAALAQSQTPRARRNIYRIRITGPEILQPAVHYCGTVAAADFSVTYPGSYHLEVLQFYEGFNYSAPPFVSADMHAANHKFKATSHLLRESAAAGAGPHTQHPCQGPGAAAAQPTAAATEQLMKAPKSSPDSAAAYHSARGGTSYSTVPTPASAMDAKLPPPGRAMPGRWATTISSLSNSPSNSSASNVTESCRICSGFNHQGRWVAAPAADAKQLAALQQVLQRTCTFHHDPKPDTWFGCPQCKSPYAGAEAEEHPVLEWLPYDCRYRKMTPLVAAQCKAALQRQQPQKRVCFVGDSQTRHIYHQVLHLIDRSDAGYGQILGLNSSAGAGRTVLNSSFMSYTVDHYGDDAIQLNTSSCSHVFFNFGQWPLSYVLPQPWDVRHYAKKVAELAVTMKQQQQHHGNRQFWLTTLPHPVMDMQQRKNPKHGFGVDWRTEPFIMLFNKVASTVMHAHGIPVVDIWSIASPLFDMSFDSGHYIGTVGLAQASVVADIVCSGLL